ncbi:MAG TPA: hypothetical protein VK196_14420 [Magnetospirillum sp.]|nr:hypothetical protein [Magnetospirillum sp.]
MKRVAIVLTVMTLGACASGPAANSGGKPALAVAQAPGGHWAVVDDYAATAAASPYVGQPVTLDAGRAVDPAGRQCNAPSYWESRGTAEQALETSLPPRAVRDSAPRNVLTVTCAGQPFMVLVTEPDGSFLTRQNDRVLRVGEPLPLAAPQAVVEATPIFLPTREPVQAKAKPDPRTLVYLASYKSEAHARAGFKTLAKVSPVLARQQPITQSVDLGKKGQWVRLYGMAADEAERKAICGQLGKRVDECGARNRE